MKKALSMAAALMFAFSSAACGSGNAASGNSADASAAKPAAPAQNITLKYWTHQEGPWDTSNQQLAAQFQKDNPGVTIQYEAYPYDDFQQKMQTAMLSKSGGADIYELWGGWAIDFSNTGALSPVPDSLISDLKNDCYPPVLGAFEYQGKYYGVPLEFNAEYGGLLALKPYFTDHNISYPTTWDDMISIGKANAKSANGIFDMQGYSFVSNDSLTYVWLSMILSSGGAYVTDGNKFDFDTQIAKDTFQKLADYVTVDKQCPIDNLTGGSDQENYMWLFQNQCLMAVHGMWTIPVGESQYNQTYGKDFDYIPMPFYGSQKKWAAETGWGLAVASSSPNADMAWKFVSYCVSPDTLMQIDIDRGLIPPRKSVANDPSFLQAVPYAKPIIDVLDGASFVGFINTDNLKEAITNAFVDMVQNNTPVDDEVKKLNADIASKQSGQ